MKKRTESISLLITTTSNYYIMFGNNIVLFTMYMVFRFWVNYINCNLIIKHNGNLYYSIFFITRRIAVWNATMIMQYFHDIWKITKIFKGYKIKKYIDVYRF